MSLEAHNCENGSGVHFLSGEVVSNYPDIIDRLNAKEMRSKLNIYSEDSELHMVLNNSDLMPVYQSTHD